MCWGIILIMFSSWQKSEETNYLLKKIPDAKIKTSNSSSASLSFWYSQQPLVLTFAYANCPGVCSPYLIQVRDQVSILGVEKEFQIMVLSIDPKDNPEELWRLVGFTHESPPPFNWTFGVLEEQDRAVLLSSLGVQTQNVSELYDHTTVTVMISKDGKIMQWVEGLPDNGQWNRLFKELTNEFVPVYPTLRSNVWTSCFQYDPTSGIWRMNWGLLMILAPSIITVCVLLVLQGITRNQRMTQTRLIQDQL